jgi:serine/threonine-protein kinase
MVAGSYDGIVGTVEMLEKGTSDDKKYKVNASNGSKYLICTYDFINIERVKKVAALLKILDTEGIPAQKLVDLIASESLRKVYLVLEWCDGADAFAIIPTLTKAEQYNLGVQSGKSSRRSTLCIYRSGMRISTGLIKSQIRPGNEFNITKNRLQV